MGKNTTDTSSYQHPLTERYASAEMITNFSPDKKFTTWRRLWIALAEAEKSLGLPITEVQIVEMKRFVGKINYNVAREFERRLRHDVMAHIRAYAKQCPNAGKIIHLGATSAFVVDNTDLVVIRDGLLILREKLLNVIHGLADQARRYADLPTTAYTHFQPAQFTTVGKRMCLWLQDLVLDLDELDHHMGHLRFLGVKGAVGTQASFLALFNGNEKKVKDLDLRVSRAMGFNETFLISGQTYTRKIDAQIHALLASISQSAHKFSNDIRLLQHLGEIEEPFEEEQVGSSAMAYKRNPIRSERIASLARLVMSLYQNAVSTAASQWFERTLDDSAGKRIALPEAFMAVDAILSLYSNIVSHLNVHQEVITAHVRRELPFIVTENILMEAVKRGGDRQELHEKIRRASGEAAQKVREGKENDLMDRLNHDPLLRLAVRHVQNDMKPEAYVGRAPSQVREFLAHEVGPRLKRHKKTRRPDVDVRV